jgi:hypothetical protein
MSTTLLRTGLWITLLVVVAYVVRETYSEQPVAEMITMSMLQKIFALGIVLVVAGAILRVFEKGTKAVVRNRCAVCKTPIPAGAIYCRAHLRAVLHKEEDRVHQTNTRR